MRKMTAVLFLVAAAASADELIVNGGFDQNATLASSTFPGWTVLSRGSGSWFEQMGTSPVPTTLGCAKDLVVPQPPNGFAAMTLSVNAGMHILYQDVNIPAGVQVTLSFDLFLESNSAFVNPFPDTINYLQRPNQQFRADLLDPAAPPDGDQVLANIYRTHNGDPLQTNGYIHLVYDVSPFAGRTVRLRFAEVDTVDCMSAGLDNVSMTTASVTPPQPRRRAAHH
jgi:hypothetical protein